MNSNDIERAVRALDDMIHAALTGYSVDPVGPRQVLAEFISTVGRERLTQAVAQQDAAEPNTDLLGRLEAAILAAEHKPGDWCQSITSMGGISTATAHMTFPGAGATEGDFGHFNSKRDALLAVTAVRALPELISRVRAAESRAAELADMLAENIGVEAGHSHSQPTSPTDHTIAYERQGLTLRWTDPRAEGMNCLVASSNPDGSIGDLMVWLPYYSEGAALTGKLAADYNAPWDGDFLAAGSPQRVELLSDHKWQLLAARPDPAKSAP